MVVLAEYFMTARSTFVFVLRSGTGKLVVDEIPDSSADDVSERAMDFTNELKVLLEAGANVNHNILALFRRLSNEFDQFLSPVIKRSRPGDVIIFVPHGDLHRLPFHALAINEVLDQDSVAAHDSWQGSGYLIERNPVAYAPSTAVLDYCVSRSTKTLNSELVAFGNSRPFGDMALPGAKEECKKIAAMFSQSRVILGASVTKEDMVMQLDGMCQGYIHVACHAYFAKDALDSAVTTYDEALTAREVQRLSSRAQMVTLSGCESGLSEVRAGDELYGLPRALLAAGVPSVLVSLWLVHDKTTPDLMIRFYEEVVKGESKVRALQQAQIKALTDETFPTPVHWAPFILIGDWK